MKKLNPTIERAIQISGSQTQLAKDVGVTQKTISMWLYGAEIKAKYLPDIVKATGGAISIIQIIQSLRDI